MKNILFINVFLISQFCIAQNTNYTDNIEKIYDLKNSKSILLKCDNKNCKIKTWNNNTVKIEANTSNKNQNISFNAKQRGDVFKIDLDILNNRNNDVNNEIADATNNSKIADSIIFNIEVNSKNNTNANTKRKEKNTTNSNITVNSFSKSNNGNSYTFSNSVSNNTNCSCPNAIDNIIITIPENLELNLDNINGNITILNGLKKLNITSKNGNIITQSVKDISIDATYSNFEFGDIENASIDVNGCNFTFNDVEKLDLDTKFSNFEFGNIATLNINESQNDNFDIDEVENLKGNFSFSNFKIKKLIKSLDINCTSGTVKIKNLDNEISKINIEGKYSDIDINAKNIPNYNINATTIYSTVKWNGKVLESNNKEETFTDNKGNGGNTKINLKCNSCTLTIK